MTETTFVQQADELWGRADRLQSASERGDVKRELALVKTAVEDAVMRFNRAMALQQTGQLQVADLEIN